MLKTFKNITRIKTRKYVFLRFQGKSAHLWRVYMCRWEHRWQRRRLLRLAMSDEAYLDRRRAINRRAAAKARRRLKEHATRVKAVHLGPIYTHIQPLSVMGVIGLGIGLVPRSPCSHHCLFFAAHELNWAELEFSQYYSSEHILSGVQRTTSTFHELMKFMERASRVSTTLPLESTCWEL